MYLLNKMYRKLFQKNYFKCQALILMNLLNHCKKITLLLKTIVVYPICEQPLTLGETYEHTNEI